MKAEEPLGVTLVSLYALQQRLTDVERDDLWALVRYQEVPDSPAEVIALLDDTLRRLRASRARVTDSDQ